MIDKTVLVIDDDRDFVVMFKEGLESIGFKVAVAYDGIQGVLQAHQTHPGVILLDVNMPAGGGANVYERLRNSIDTARIPVVFTTGVPIDEIKGRIRPGPKTYFLKKPVSLAQIRVVLGQVLAVPVPSGMPPADAAGKEYDLSRGTGRITPPGAATSASHETPGSDPPLQPAAAAPTFMVVPAAVPSAGAAAAARVHEFEVRVTYGDTDKMGVIYYANYFKFFELGRVELMRSLGIRYRDLELDRKLYLPVTEAQCRYHGPSRYDDLLRVSTRLAHLGRASIAFHYEIHDRDSADRLVASGHTRHAVVNERWQPTRIPQDLETLLRSYVFE